MQEGLPTFMSCAYRLGKAWPSVLERMFLGVLLVAVSLMDKIGKKEKADAISKMSCSEAQGGRSVKRLRVLPFVWK